MITIQLLTKVTPELEAFQHKEWEDADMEHYGKIKEWKKEAQILQATINNELVGVLELTIASGVMHIDSLIVKHTMHGQGIGKRLMEEAEAIARKQSIHKMYLETGKTWNATKFYEALGYKKTGELPMHAYKNDYVIYSKFLS